MPNDFRRKIDGPIETKEEREKRMKREAREEGIDWITTGVLMIGIAVMAVVFFV